MTPGTSGPRAPDEKAPEVPGENRFFPEPRFVAMPELRRLPDGAGEIWLAERKEWKRVGALFLAVLDGLAAGRTFSDVAEHLPAVEGIRPKQGKALARHFVWQLHKLGVVHLPLPEPPRVWKGRYERVRELGRGGLGVAHLANDLAHGARPVVVKHPWGVLNPISRGQRALAREARVLARLDHPGVPKLVETFVSDGLLHLVRDFVDGEDLQRRFVRPREPARGDPRPVARQIGEVLAHLHDRGELLLDIAPGNFLVRADGRVLIIDLGTAAEHEGGRVPLVAPVGSPGYVAPEMIWPPQGTERAATFATEVCSLGRLYAALLLGRAPGRRETGAELVAALREAQVPGEDVAVVAACANDDPAARPPDMRAVLRLLAP